MLNSSDATPSKPARKRIQFTHQQKQEIRDFYRSHPQCTAKVLRLWFEAKHGLPLRPSTISTILRSADKSSVSNNSIRARLPKYPELENRLRQWVEKRMLIERDNSNFYITNEMLKTAAQEIWKSFPECNSNGNIVGISSGHPPSFSEGWIEKFKRRTNMPRLRRHSTSRKSNESASPAATTAPVMVAKSPESPMTNICATNSNATFNSINLPQQQQQQQPQEHQHFQYLNPIHYASPPSSKIKLPSPYELLTSTSPPAFITSPSPASTPLPFSKSSPAYSSPESVSSIHSILNPVEEDDEINDNDNDNNSNLNNNNQLDSSQQYFTPRTPRVSQQQPDPISNLIPDSVAKCHLNILKIYMEQTQSTRPFDLELQKTFASFEKVIESRTAAAMTATPTIGPSDAIAASSPSSQPSASIRV